MARATQRMVNLIVSSAVGLHARPAAMLVRVAQAYEAEIHIEHNGIRANAKSILGILTLGVETGAEVTLIAGGHDADAAIEAIENLFICGFDDADTQWNGQCVAAGRQYEGVGWQGEQSRRATALSAAPRL